MIPKRYLLCSLQERTKHNNLYRFVVLAEQIESILVQEVEESLIQYLGGQDVGQ